MILNITEHLFFVYFIALTVSNSGGFFCYESDRLLN